MRKACSPSRESGTWAEGVTAGGCSAIGNGPASQLNYRHMVGKQFGLKKRYLAMKIDLL